MTDGNVELSYPVDPALVTRGRRAVERRAGSTVEAAYPSLRWLVVSLPFAVAVGLGAMNLSPGPEVEAMQWPRDLPLPQPAFFLTPLLVVGAAALGYLIAGERRRTALLRMLRFAARTGAVRLAIGPEGVTERIGGVEVHLPWHSVEGLVEFRGGIALAAGPHIVVLPASALPETITAARLRALAFPAAGTAATADAPGAAHAH